MTPPSTAAEMAAIAQANGWEVRWAPRRRCRMVAVKGARWVVADATGLDWPVHTAQLRGAPLWDSRARTETRITVLRAILES